jgi:hypothetical protein
MHGQSERLQPATQQMFGMGGRTEAQSEQAADGITGRADCNGHLGCCSTYKKCCSPVKVLILCHNTEDTHETYQIYTCTGFNLHDTSEKPQDTHSKTHFRQAVPYLSITSISRNGLIYSVLLLYRANDDPRPTFEVQRIKPLEYLSVHHSSSHQSTLDVLSTVKNNHNASGQLSRYSQSRSVQCPSPLAHLQVLCPMTFY